MGGKALARTIASAMLAQNEGGQLVRRSAILYSSENDERFPARAEQLAN